MAQQYDTPTETYRSSTGDAAAGGSVAETHRTTDHYGDAVQQSSQIGDQSSTPGPQSTEIGQQSSQTGSGATHQRTTQSMGTSQQEMPLEDALTDEMRVALHDFVQSATVCEWCADRCIDEGSNMAECIRLCRDVADLAALNVQFISRDSTFGPAAAEVFADAAEACAQECARHHHRHCQECAETLSRAARSTRKMLASFGGASQGPRL